MSKRARLLLVLFFMVIAGVFIYPTVKWYFFVPEEEKTVAQASVEEVRRYSQTKALEVLERLKQGVRENPDAELPEDLSFLITYAKRNYRIAKEPLPGKWSYKSVLSSFVDEKEALETIEDYFRARIISLKELRNRTLQLGLDLSGGLTVTLAPDFSSLAERLGHEPTDVERRDAVDRALEVLNNRIDRFGVTEPQIRKLEGNKILIEIPGDPDPTRVNSFLMGKGRLTFHIVDDETTQKLIEYQRQTGITDPAILAERVDFVPAGTKIAGYYTKDKYGVDKLVRSIAIYEEVGLDGTYLTSAQVSRDPLTGKPVVLFSLNSEGSDIFYKLTSANVDRSLAIVLDDKVKAYATIQEPIRGNVQITGFSTEEAQNISLILRTAALPVDLVIEDYEAVGASLGEDSIRRGVQAIVLGFALVVFFMILYYKGAGIVADIALLLNLFFMTALLSVFNFTLTLTSIAGVILTVGMAVDANVIIYERIKEELRLGKTPASAVKAGFSKAFWTIVDANVTTFIAAIFLSQVGRGPIQGFAVTLAIGIVSSMFTALVVSRLIFDYLVEQRKVKKLSISWRL
ncbi:protein-export membrane protein SecD [Spirochaeta thermophila DSM 6578]|uniref:Protein translocase subunit SecD n=1 Tax=Winmispira thermophila (strain ATCC 700085 / DSM 6578 / Z-1203) TaxID=869211 RepID=G0GEB8_WINT7|nr:protein translocase subunit SecD [Spirochaeta thermophila]AEJ62255.1 protein-export membrane protein SecD [Spirochaeta thermophila DSM 6578]